MKRVKLIVAYDGTNYCGWQVQPNGITIEQVLNENLSKLLGEEITVTGASRTDSGVHSMGNVAIFDTETRMPADKISFALNQRLPEDIVVQDSCEVPSDWHPRYQENISKTYEYHIYNAAVPNPLKTRYCTFVSFPMDVEQDTVRTVYDLIIEKKDDEIVLRITGNGFLYNMVRIIAGVLIRVGRGFYAPEKVKEILDAKVHTSEGATAPPNGLVLMKIDYN